MKITILFQYLIIMNLSSGTLLFFFFKQTIRTLLPREFPVLLKLSGITVLNSVPNYNN